MFKEGDIILCDGKIAEVLKGYPKGSLPYYLVQFEDGTYDFTWGYSCKFYDVDKIFTVRRISLSEAKPNLSILWPAGGGSGVYIQAVELYYFDILTEEELSIINELNK